MTFSVHAEHAHGPLLTTRPGQRNRGAAPRGSAGACETQTESIVWRTRVFRDPANAAALAIGTFSTKAYVSAMNVRAKCAVDACMSSHVALAPNAGLGDEALRLTGRDGTSALQLGDGLLTYLELRPVRAVRGSLARIFDVLEKASPAHVDRGLAWICARGEPDDAEAVAQLMLRWVAEGAQSFYVLARFAGLTRWLLDHGSKTLASRQRALLLPLLVDVARNHAPDCVARALRLLAHNDHGSVAWSPGYADILWDGLELARGRGEGAELLSDLLCLPGAALSIGAAEFFAPLESDRPHARAEFVRELAKGELPLRQLVEGWTRAMRVHALPACSIALGSLLACTEAMLKLTPERDHALQAWVTFVGTELLRHMDTCRSAGDLAHAPRRLEKLVQQPELQAGLRKALEYALRDKDGHAFAEAKAILANDPAPGAVHAAVHALPARGQAYARDSES